MKLIIDIEPRYCDDMQSGVKELYYEAINRITEAVRNGKPYEERPQGEWEVHGMICYCSNCGHDCGESGDNFCGNCGADMRGSAK